MMTAITQMPTRAFTVTVTTMFRRISYVALAPTSAQAIADALEVFDIAGVTAIPSQPSH